MKQRPFELNLLRGQRCIEGPAWRSKIAPSLPAKFLKKVDDPWLVAYCRYLTLRAAGTEPSPRDKTTYAQIAAAAALNDDPQQAAALKMMVAANLSGLDVGKRLGIEPEIVTAWEALFFDVRDLRQATSWFAAHVVERERKQGNAELAGRLKLAYCVGPVAVRTILDADQAVAVDVADHLFAKKLALQVKLDTALAMPLETAEQSVSFVKSVTEMDVATKKIELASAKLAQRCQLASERHELSVLRCELAIKRAEQRVAEEHSKAAKQQNQLADKARYREAGRDMQRLLEDANRAARDERIAASPLTQISWETEPVTRLDIGTTAEMIVPFASAKESANTPQPSSQSDSHARGKVAAGTTDRNSPTAKSSEPVTRYA